MQGLTPAPVPIVAAQPEQTAPSAPPGDTKPNAAAPDVQAPPSDQSVPAAPPDISDAGSLTSGGQTHDALDNGVTFDPSKDDQLDMGGRLDQGARLFALQARYQDWGDGANDY